MRKIIEENWTAQAQESLEENLTAQADGNLEAPDKKLVLVL